MMLKAKQNSFLKWFIGIVLLIVALCSFMTIAFAAPDGWVTCSICGKGFGYGITASNRYETVYSVPSLNGLTNSGMSYHEANSNGDSVDVALYNNKEICLSCLENKIAEYKASTLNATVPASLPIHVGEDGKVTTASNASITNNGSNPIEVSSINITASSGWTVQSKVDATNAKAGSKVIAIGFNNSWATPNSGNASGSVNTSDFGKISASGTLNLAYDAVIPVAAAGGSSDETAATATIVVAFPEAPTLAAGPNWYKSSENRNTITKITLMDSYTPTTTADETWAADVNETGDITCYRTGTEIIMAGNGAGKILANPNSNYMFSNSNYGNRFEKLTAIENLRRLDTSKVTNMRSMFDECRELASLDISGFDTSKVTIMGYMFSQCDGLTSLDSSNFDTSKVTNMSHMFASCSKLTSIDVSGFKTSNVTNMSGMFYQCSGLASLDISGFDTSKVTNMSYMFYQCFGLTSLDSSNFDTSKVTNMSYMFTACSKLTSIDVSGFKTSNVTNMSDMFGYCSELTSIDVSGFKTSNVTNMSYMFEACRGLTSLDISGFDTSKVTNMSYMFYDCFKLTSLDVSNFDTSNVTNMSYMFASCIGLKSLDVSNFDTSNVTNMSNMFDYCRGLTSLDISGFDTSKVTNMRYMFYKCYELSTIYAGDTWNTDKVTNSSDMFRKCTNLPNFNSSIIDKTAATFTTNGGYLTRKAAAKSLKLNVDQSGTVNGYTEQSAA